MADFLSALSQGPQTPSISVPTGPTDEELILDFQVKISTTCKQIVSHGQAVNQVRKQLDDLLKAFLKLHADMADLDINSDAVIDVRLKADEVCSLIKERLDCLSTVSGELWSAFHKMLDASREAMRAFPAEFGTATGPRPALTQLTTAARTLCDAALAFASLAQHRLSGTELPFTPDPAAVEEIIKEVSRARSMVNQIMAVERAAVAFGWLG